MSDVVAFLRARLDEDEEACGPAGSDWSSYCDAGEGTHLVPGRVLRDIKAKRRIVDEMGSDLAHDDGGPSTARWTLGVLAAIWPDHPDFRLGQGRCRMSEASTETRTASQREYPPYSGPEPTCPKCLNEGASTLYMQVGECTHGTDDCWRGLQLNERLHRSCSNCGFSWDEAIR